MRSFFYVCAPIYPAQKKFKKTQLFFYPRTKKLWIHTKHEHEKHVAWLKTRHNQLSENASSVFLSLENLLQVKENVGKQNELKR